jgi:hypothetical protein
VLKFVVSSKNVKGGKKKWVKKKNDGEKLVKNVNKGQQWIIYRKNTIAEVPPLGRVRWKTK